MASHNDLVNSEDDYLRLFDGAGGCRFIGESSTSYTKLPRFHCDLGRIACIVSEPRFIYILRDPVERAISHYWHLVCWESERREILEAIRGEAHYRAVSYYAMQLAPYFEVFGRNRVMILTYEKLRRDPIYTVQSIYRWLGIDATHVPSNIRTRYNQTPRPIRQDRGVQWLNRLRNSWFWEVAGPLVPRRIRAVGRSLSERRLEVMSVSTKAAVQYLKPIQRKETMELCELLGRQFPEWTTLYDETG